MIKSTCRTGGFWRGVIGPGYNKQPLKMEQDAISRKLSKRPKEKVNYCANVNGALNESNAVFNTLQCRGNLDNYNHLRGA